MNRAYTFKIVVVSEDVASAIRAQELSVRLADQLKPACKLDCGHWSFAELSHAPMRNRAAKEARKAGMIIFSAQRAVDLPVPVKNWIEDWSPRKRGSASAMVAMLAPEARTYRQTLPLCSYLRATAGKCDMDFFSNESGGSEAPDLSAGVNPASSVDSHPVEMDAPFQPVAFQDGGGERGWGIND